VVRSNRLDDPSIRGMINVRDVTLAQRGGLDALRREYEGTRQTNRNASSGGARPNARFTFVSDHAEAILGYRRRNAGRRNPLVLVRPHPRRTGSGRLFCRKAVEEEGHDLMPHDLSSKAGIELWLRDIVRVGVEDGVPATVRRYGGRHETQGGRGGLKESREALQEWQWADSPAAVTTVQPPPLLGQITCVARRWGNLLGYRPRNAQDLAKDNPPRGPRGVLAEDRRSKRDGRARYWQVPPVHWDGRVDVGVEDHAEFGTKGSQ